MLLLTDIGMVKKAALFVVCLSLFFSSTVPLVLADGMIIPPPYNNLYETAQKAVIWYENNVETLILSTTFQGDAQNFGWLVPTPQKPEVDQASDELFTALEELTQPKYYPEPLPLLGAPGLGLEKQNGPAPPTIVETKKVDIYDITVLRATDNQGLIDWLTKNGYQYPTDRQYLLQSYIDQNWFFVAIKVDSGAIKAAGSYLESGHATPIQLTFQSDKIIYPLKISGLATQETKNPSNKVAYSFETGLENWSQLSPLKIGTEPQRQQGIIIQPLTVTTTSSTSFHGKSAVQMIVMDGDILDYGGVMRWFNTLQSRKTYTVSAYVSAPEVASGSAYISTSSGSSGSSVSQKIDISGLKDWKRITHTFTANAQNATVRLLVDNVKNGEKVYWDAVQIEEGGQVTPFDETAIGSNFGMAEPTIAPRRVADVTVLIYVFADQKKDLPGFTTSYASWVPPQKIANLAFTPDGSKPWRQPQNKFYLTKLSRTMAPSAMTNDLILRNADNNDSVNAEGFPEFSQLRFFGVIAVILVVWVGLIVIGWLWLRKGKNKVKNLESEV